MAQIAGAFTAKDLYKLISSHSSMPNCIDLLRMNYQQADIASLYAHVLLIEQVLNSRNELPLNKYNALLATQQLLSTARYPALLFIQIYLLPIIADITLCLTRMRSEDELETYFIDRGYRQSIGIRKLGQKFVRRGAAIALLAAAIKPYQNVLHTQISVPSSFQLVAATLRKGGLMIELDHTPRQMQVMRITFLREMKGLNPQVFADFIARKLKEDVVFKQCISGSVRKLMQSEDALLTIPAINLCVSILSEISRHFPQKKIYLALFSSFVRQGHVYAIVVAHNATFLSEIFQQIVKVPGQQGLNAGRFIYPQVEASLQDKLDFYCEFLKCLEIWAVCLPHNQIGEESQMARLYAFLKIERNFIFPEILLMRRIQLQFNQFLEKKEQQNQEILRVIQADQNLMAECAKMKSSVINLSSRMQKTKRPQIRPIVSSESESVTESSGSGSRSGSGSGSSEELMTKLKSLLREATAHIEELIYEQKIVENIQLLKLFQKEWSNLRENCRQEITDSLIKQGDELKHKISLVYPLYLRFKKKTIPFGSFRRRVANILGFRLQDFGLQTYDDYAVENPPLSSKCSQEEANKTITEVSKQSSSVNHLGCWSKLKLDTICKEPIKHASLPQAKQKPKQQTPVQQSPRQQPQVNEYGFRQLLIKRKMYLNQSKKSIRSKKSVQTPQSHNKSILTSSILNSNEDTPKNIDKIIEISHDPIKNEKAKAQMILNNTNVQRNMTFSDKSSNNSEQSLSQYPNIAQYNADKHNKMNVYEIYQIQINGKESKRQIKPLIHQEESLQERINHSCSLRSRLYLQKIRYSSTSKAIQQYTHKVNLSISNKTSFNSTRNTSKSIINRQYRRIALLQNKHHQSLTKGQLTQSKEEMPSYGDVSANNSQGNVLNSSLFSNQSKKPTLLINSTLNLQQYIDFFPKDRNQKVIKNCLKNKGLLFSNEDIEVGFVHFRKDNALSIILYLTASKSLQISKFQILSSPQLLIRSDHSAAKELKKGRQEIIKIDTIVQETPFSLPLMQMRLKLQGGLTKQVQFILPCTFSKYLLVKSIDVERYETMSIDNHTTYIKTPNFKITNKQIFTKKITKFFSIPSIQKHYQNNAICICECIFQSKIFILKVIHQQNDKGVIVGFSPTKHTKELQFLLSTLSFVIAQ